MAYTKRWYVTKAFSKIGLADYVYDIQPEQLQECLENLDSMMATWDGQGIRVGWSIPNAEDQSSLDDEVDVPYQAREAIYYQLGMRIAPNFGKTLSTDYKVDAKDALESLMLFTARPTPMQYPSTLPSGAGNKPWRTVDNPFLGPPADAIVAGSDSPIDFGTLVPESDS
jgi:hypothetical protein